MSGPQEQVRRIKNSLQAVRDQMRTIIRQGVETTKGELEEANIRQLQSGRRADGTSLPHYSPGSVARGKPAGPMRLYDTGRFYEGISAETSPDQVQLKGRDSKTTMLQQRYGENIIGVHQQLRHEYAHGPLKEEVIRTIRKSLAK